MSLKVEILKAFMENETLVDSMKNCDHGDNGSYNPYHLEGSVWTHTMLVYNQADDNDYISLIMALCHDIGKVLTRNIKENGKVTFYGHADKSVQPTIDFLSFLNTKGIISDKEEEDFIKYGLPVMANHMIYYQNINKHQHFVYNNNPETFTMLQFYMNKMADMDTKGSICKSDKIDEKKKNMVYESFKPLKVDEDLPNIIIWSGLPASGKDYLAKQNGYPIVSFDDIRVSIFKSHSKKEVLDNLEECDLYQMAFDYCLDNKIDLNKILIRDIKSLVDKKEMNINICNTSLTRKDRRRIINSLNKNKFNFFIKQVFSPTKSITYRNISRESKNVPSNVIVRMSERINVATHFEDGVIDINYVYNK